MTEPGSPFDLDDAANRFPIHPGDMEAVVSRARRRTQVQRRVASVALAAVVVAAVPVAQRVVSSPDRETPLATSGSLERRPLGLSWRRVEPKATVGIARDVSTEAPLYALSSSPGERMVQDRQPSRVVWRSTDGIEWDTASTLGPDLYLSDLDIAGDRVYAVGTAPGQAATDGRRSTLRSAELVVGWSDDQARHWQKKALPLDLPDELPTGFGTVSAVDVASGSKGTVAVAVLHAALDVPAVLPDGAPAPYGWATTDAGVDVLGPEKDAPCPEGFTDGKKPVPGEPPGEVAPTWCQRGAETVTLPPQEVRGVTASYTWDQLGVEGDLRRAVRRVPIAFFAPAGSTDFERVDLPDGEAGVAAVSVEAREDGFDFVSTTVDGLGRGMDDVALLQSADGRSWKKADLPDRLGWFSALGALDGRPAMVTSNSSGARLTAADGTGAWHSLPLSGAVDPAVLEDRMVTAGSAAFGSFGVAVHAVLIPAESKRDERAAAHRLLLSRDGTTWDDVALDEVVGEPHAVVTRITVTGDEVVVTASLPVDGRPEGPRRQVVLVGTPS